MTIWSQYYSYQYPFSTVADFNFNSMPYSNLFSMPAIASNSVFDNNIFGFTPSTDFCALSQNTYPQQYFSPINLTNPFMTYDFQPRLNTDNIFSGINSVSTSPVLGTTDNIFGFLNTVNKNINTITPASTQTSNNIFGFLTTSSTRTNTSFNTSTNLQSLNKVGYNSAKTQKLTTAINTTSPHRWGDERCAAHVKEAIQQAGLGTYSSGNAYQMVSQLRNNPNFKEISTAGLNLSQLPAGCILVYDRGVAGYSSEYGHTEITLGNGQALSSGVTQNIRNGARVFVPV